MEKVDTKTLVEAIFKTVEMWTKMRLEGDVGKEMLQDSGAEMKPWMTHARMSEGSFQVERRQAVE